MITKSILDMLEMDNITDYFEYIIKNYESGQHKHARELFNQLSEGLEGQREVFFDWVETNYYYEAHDCDAIGELQLIRNYFEKK